eukprot:3938850-Rhodomonas_salina.1
MSQRLEFGGVAEAGGDLCSFDAVCVVSVGAGVRCGVPGRRLRCQRIARCRYEKYASESELFYCDSGVD